MVQEITKSLEKTLHTSVSIEHVDLWFFNTLSVKKIFIADLEGDTLIAAKEINAKISLLALFKKEVHVRTLNCIEPNIYVKIDKDGATNIDFIKKLLPKNSQFPAIIFRVDEIKIREGKLALRNDKAVPQKRETAFNKGHIKLFHLNTTIKIEKFSSSQLITEIKHLSFQEQSGFILTDINTAINATDSTCAIPYLKIKLPHSQLELDSIFINYQTPITESKNLNKLKFNTQIKPSEIRLNDLYFFVPAFKGLQKPVLISGQLTGYIDNFRANQLKISYGSDMAFDGNFQFTGLPNMDDTFIYAELNDISATPQGIQDLVANLQQKPFILPKELRNLGKCHYKGNITGFFSNPVLFGHLTTNIGTISTDISLKFDKAFTNLNLEGFIKSNRIQLAKITPPQSGLGDVSFNIKTKLEVGSDQPLKTTADLTISSFSFKNYTYKNIKVNGKYTDKHFIGDVDIKDPNGQLKFIGNIDWKSSANKYTFSADISNFKPYALNLTKANPDLALFMNVDAKFEGPNNEFLNGSILIDSLLLNNNNKSYLLDKILITAQKLNNNEEKSISITSPIINGDLTGSYTFSALKHNLTSLVEQALPVFGKKTPIHQEAFKNNLALDIEIASTKELADILGFSTFTPEVSTISGVFDEYAHTCNLSINIPKVANFKKELAHNVALNFDNENKRLNATLEAHTTTQTNDTITIILDLQGKNDTITTRLSWNNTTPKAVLAGEFLSKTYFDYLNDSLNAHIQILPTEIVLKNTLWTINAAKINTNFHQINISNMVVENDKQHMRIHGVASKSINDVIAVDLNNINLDFISSLLPENSSVHFGGDVTGKAMIYQALAKPIFEANILATGFKLNHAYLGEVHAISTWDNDNKKIAFGGSVIADNRDTTAILDGGYFLGQDSLDIIGRAHKLDLRFLDLYLSSVLKNVQGFASGTVHIYGNTKKKQVTVTAEAYAENAQLSIDFLKTTYFFNDSIHLSPTEIKFSNITILDSDGNKGKLNGYVRHKYFKNLDYKLDIDCAKMKVLNTTKKDNSDFYGIAYATGKALIKGDDKSTNITVVASTDKKSKLVVPFGAATATENSFITFVDRNAPKIRRLTETKTDDDSDNEIIINLMVDITPNAEIQLLVDPQAGDIIKGTGDGDLRIEYNTKQGEFRMYGNYEIEQGSYLFTFQDALRKGFKVKQGSSLNFNGDPTNPTVNINAIYQLNASLLDVLDQSIIESSNRTTVPVQCILNLTGNLMNPTIKFDLNLPNSDEELNRALQAVVNTDEMMNRQIIYLLVLGKFFTPESMKSTGSIVSQNDLLAVASSTLSTQLNNWASQMFENWNFGINFRSSGEGDMKSNEYEFNFLYTPNNRITLNGNVGYRDDNLSSSKFIGDFDFEYKLIQSGKLSAKAYTHTNDYKEFKTALTTQGVGLVYRESFNSLPELWNNWKTSALESKKERAEKKQVREAKKAIKKADKENKKREKQENKQRVIPTENH